MKVILQRTQMITGKDYDYAYSVYVPVSEISADHRKEIPYTTITNVNLEQVECVSYAHATDTTAWKMEPGWSRYQRWNLHEKAAQAGALELLKKSFSELEGLTKYPTLWTSIPSRPSLGSKSVIVEI